MLDVQRERLRHLVANAILELWKKETGSLSPVIIEGTICITTGNGRTTVVQVSNQFSSAIPDGTEDGGPTFNTPKRKMISLPSPFPYSPQLDIAQNSAIGAPYWEELSPASISSPSTESALINRLSRPRALSAFKPARHISQNSSTSEKSMDISVKEDDHDNSDIEDNEDSGVVADTSSNISAGPIIPGTGFYMEDKTSKKTQNDNKDHTNDNGKGDTIENEDKDETIDKSSKETRFAGPLMSTPKTDSKSSTFTIPTSSATPSDADALDLSSGRKEDDLALSSPQNYTAQVRNVIRQRLLATRQNSSDSRDNSQQGIDTNGENGDDDSRSPITSDHGLSPLPPLMNLSLASPTMLPLPYPPMLRSPMPPSPSPVSDIMRLNRQESPIFTPEMISPGRSLSSPYDQNGNDKETLYVNEKGEPQKVYRCNFCSKTFLFKSKYYEHLPVHTNVRPFQCHLCSRTYKYKYDLRVHLRTHMGIPTKSTVCPFCSVKFDTNKMLRLHIQDFHHSAASHLEPSAASSENGGSTSEPVSPAL